MGNKTTVDEKKLRLSVTKIIDNIIADIPMDARIQDMKHNFETVLPKTVSEDITKIFSEFFSRGTLSMFDGIVSALKVTK